MELEEGVHTEAACGGGVEIVDVKVEGSVVCVGGEMRGMVDAVRVGLVTYLYVFGSRRRAAGGQ